MSSQWYVVPTFLLHCIFGHGAHGGRERSEPSRVLVHFQTESIFEAAYALDVREAIVVAFDDGGISGRPQRRRGSRLRNPINVRGEEEPMANAINGSIADDIIFDGCVVDGAGMCGEI